MQVTNPHDSFFKEAFSYQEVAVDFLNFYLPAEIAKLFDLSSLRSLKETFVDQELQQHYSDLLYSVSLKDGQDAYVYILFEHKSHPEPLVALQLLRYVVKICENSIKEKVPLRPSFQIVVYHGKEKWNVGQNFQSLFVVPEIIKDFFPEFKYWLCDLSCYKDEELKGRALSQVAFLAMKHIFDDNLSHFLPEIFALFKDLLIPERTGLHFIEAVLRYFISGSDKITDKELKEVIESTLPEGGNILHTIAQEWLKQGEQVGFQQGEQVGFQKGEQVGLQKGQLFALLEGIKLGLELKFGTEGLRELPQIRKIKDIDILHTIHASIRSVTSLVELRQFYPKNSGQ